MLSCRHLLVLAGVLFLLVGTPLLSQAAPPGQGPLGPSDETLIDQLTHRTPMILTPLTPAAASTTFGATTWTVKLIPISR